MKCDVNFFYFIDNYIQRTFTGLEFRVLQLKIGIEIIGSYETSIKKWSTLKIYQWISFYLIFQDKFTFMYRFSFYSNY